MTKNCKLIVCFFLSFLIFSGCFSPWKDDTETATLTLNLGGSARQGRWVTPEIHDELRHTIELFNDTNSFVFNAKGGDIIHLTVIPGNWDILITSKKPDNTVYSTGGNSANILAGQDNYVTVPMYEGEQIKVPGDDLIEKLEWIKKNATSGLNYLVEVDKDDEINPQTLSYSGKRRIKIILEGVEQDDDDEERTISLNPDLEQDDDKGSMFTVGKGVTLVLENITLVGIGDPENLMGNTKYNIGALVAVNSGSLVMEEGSKITGNVNYDFDKEGRWGSDGGGVSVVSGTFTMNSGEISYNRASNGGGVRLWDSTFHMNGGTITENQARCEGGGVGVSASNFYMRDGAEISNNSVDDFEEDQDYYMYSELKYGESYAGSGGGVFVWKGDYPKGNFTMYGGEISGNTARNGGGVCLSVNVVFTMHDGDIFKNEAIGGYFYARTHGTGEFPEPIEGIYSKSGYGGGVDVGGSATFNMRGGSIYGNTAEGFEEEGHKSGLAKDSEVYEVQCRERAGQGGGVKVGDGNNSKFTMTGGTIGTSNNPNTADNGGGVAVVAWYGIVTFNMSSYTTISYNVANYVGGGVYVNNGIFNMSGNATITHNEAHEKGGGGVLVEGEGVWLEEERMIQTSFEMHGSVSINNNNATTGEGGGVYLRDGPMFLRTSGEIKENLANSIDNQVYARFYDYKAYINETIKTSDKKLGFTGTDIWSEDDVWIREVL
ncbi:MAG: hypothetical protein LBU66_07170 [Treponema sp.]|nr:hypothetical protein [Treponema sp.]